jgi:hypothetical protein
MSDVLCLVIFPLRPYFFFHSCSPADDQAVSPTAGHSLQKRDPIAALLPHRFSTTSVFTSQTAAIGYFSGWDGHYRSHRSMLSFARN